jgi:hypothetical protein
MQGPCQAITFHSPRSRADCDNRGLGAAQAFEAIGWAFPLGRILENAAVEQEGFRREYGRAPKMTFGVVVGLRCRRPYRQGETRAAGVGAARELITTRAGSTIAVDEA